MEDKIILNEKDMAEAHIELAKQYIFKACSTGKKEKIIKNLLIAKSSIQKSLSLLNSKL